MYLDSNEQFNNDYKWVIQSIDNTLQWITNIENKGYTPEKLEAKQEKRRKTEDSGHQS